jgi:hypothetical protein
MRVAVNYRRSVFGAAHASELEDLIHDSKWVWGDPWLGGSGTAAAAGSLDGLAAGRAAQEAVSKPAGVRLTGA